MANILEINMLTKKQRDIISRKRIIEQEDPIKQKVQNSIKREIEQKITPKEGESLFDKAAKFFKEYPTPISYIKKNYLTPQKQLVFRVGQGVQGVDQSQFPEKTYQETPSVAKQKFTAFRDVFTGESSETRAKERQDPRILKLLNQLAKGEINEQQFKELSDPIKKENENYLKETFNTTPEKVAKEKSEREAVNIIGSMEVGGLNNVVNKIVKATTIKETREIAESIGKKWTEDFADSILTAKTQKEAKSILSKNTPKLQDLNDAESDFIKNKFIDFIDNKAKPEDFIKDGELIDDWGKRIENGNITKSELGEMANYLEKKGVKVFDTTKKIDPLIQEAKKYNSADEFVKAQNKLYHGTPHKFDKFNEKTTFFTQDKNFAENVASEQTDNIINKLETETRPDGSAYYPEIMERYGKVNLFDGSNPEHLKKLENILPENVKETSYIGGQWNATKKDVIDTIKNGGKETWTSFEGDVQYAIKKLGFDGWKMSEGGKETIGVFSPNKLKTKQQLTDIWKKANGKQEALGVAAGFEQDEEGNIGFNPVKAAAGVGVMGGIKVAKNKGVASKVKAKLSNGKKYIYNIFKKEGADDVLDDLYRSRDKEELSNSLKNLYNNETAGKVSIEFDNARAGERSAYGFGVNEGDKLVFTREGSTFPKWIPEHLRKKPLLNDVIKNLQEGTVPKGTAQRELYNVVVKKIVKEEGLNIKAVKNTIKRFETVAKKEVAEVKQIKATAKKSRTQAMSQAKKATGKLPKKDLKKTINRSLGMRRTPLITTEEKALREKLRVASIYSKIGKKHAIKTTAQLRSAVREYAKDLPVGVRNKLLSKESFAGIKSKKQLEAMLDRVDLLRAKVLQRDEKVSLQKEVKRLLKVAREKGLIGKAKMEARKETGVGNLIRITKDGKEVRRGVEGLSIEQLKEYKKVLLKKIDTTPKPVKSLSKEEWKKIGSVGTSEQKKSTKFTQGLEKAIGVISTGIEKYGGKYLKSAIREYKFELSKLSFKYVGEIEKFQKTIGKFKGEKLDNLAYHLYNQSFDEVRNLLGENSKELDKVIAVLDDIHERANKVGLNVGKLQNYFPRIVKDYDGLFKAYSEKYGKNGRSYFEKVLNDYANSKGKKLIELSIEEKSDVLTKTLRGYGQGKINAGNAQRARQFKELPAEFLQYYHAPKDSLSMYISKMNQRIELKKIFGLEGFEQDSIGSLVEKVNASPSEKQLLQEYLSGILSPQGQENAFWQTLRKSATLAFLSHFSQTIFQTSDIGKNMYKHGMFRAVASLFREKPFLRDKMFMDITHEFADSQLIKNSLKIVGFDRLDRLNNEAFMANTFREATRLAKRGKGAGFRELQDYADFTFRGNKERIAKFFDDVKNQRVTDETALYVWNKVLDVDPRDLMEMPLMYAKHPNLRAAYSMKSYGIKVLDMYRNEARSGKPTWKKSKNMIMLTAYLTAAGASGAQLRNWWRGEDKSFSDTVVNQALQLMMMSTYDVGSVERDGLGMTIFKKLKPPTRPLDDLVNDIRTMGDGKGFKSIRNIPIIGDEIYYRAGAGKDKIEKNKKQEGSFNKKLPTKKLPTKKKLPKKKLPKK